MLVIRRFGWLFSFEPPWSLRPVAWRTGWCGLRWAHFPGWTPGSSWQCTWVSSVRSYFPRLASHSWIEPFRAFPPVRGKSVSILILRAVRRMLFDFVVVWVWSFRWGAFNVWIVWLWEVTGIPSFDQQRTMRLGLVIKVYLCCRVPYW